MPVVRNRARRTSWLLGRKSLTNNLSRSKKKLKERSACEVTQRRGGHELAQIVLQRIFITPHSCLLDSAIRPHILERSLVFDWDGFEGVQVSLFHNEWEVNLRERGVRTWAGGHLTSGAYLEAGEIKAKTHCCILKFERDLELLHRIHNHPQAIDDVLEDDDSPFGLFVLGEAIPSVDQSHLLQNS